MKNQSVSDFVAAAMDAVLNSPEHKSLFASQYKTAQSMADKQCSKCGSKHSDKDSCMADDNDARKAKKESKESSSDSSSADDDNDARKKKEKESSDSSSADDDNDARKKKEKESSSDSSSADDQDAKKKKESKDSDSSSADDQFDSDADKPVVGAGGKSVEFKQPAHITAKPPAKADDHAANTLSSSQSNPYPKSMESGYRPGDVLRADDVEVSAAFDVAIDSLLTASAALDSVGLGRGSALTLKIASLVVEAKKKDKDSKKSKKSKDSQSAKDKKSPKKDDKKSSSKDSHSAKDKKSSDKKDDKKSSSKSSK